MLQDNINTDLTNALKSGDSLTTEVLRGLNAALKNKAIEKRGKGEGEELTDEEAVAVLQKELKKRQEAAELYSQGNRPELADKERHEAEVIAKYLPEQLGEVELEKMVDEVLSETEDKSFGAVMKAVMERAQNQADGKLVSEIVKKRLSDQQ